MNCIYLYILYIDPTEATYSVQYMHVFSPSVWFDSPRLALVVSLLVFFISYVPALFILPFTDDIP